MQPTITPLQATELCRKTDGICIDGWKFTFEGTRAILIEDMAPMAINLENNTEMFCSGEIGDRVTEDTVWVSA